MTPIEAAREALDPSGNQTRRAIIAFLDAVLADPELLWRIDCAVQTSDLGIPQTVIKALKQEASR